jgi:hypothetical protein
MKQNLDFIVFPKQDNWNKFGYDVRILDSLASFFHFRGPCAATIKYKDILYVSYNSQVPNSDKLIALQSKTVFDFIHKASEQDLLSLYLLLNLDFVDFVSNQARYENNVGLKENLLKFKEIHKALKPKMLKSLEETKELINLSDFSEITKYYYSLIDFLLKEQKETEVMEQLLRPLQDSYKVHYYVKQQGYSFNKVIVLDNKEGIHADSNIINCFPFANKIEYVGVSKLCCGYCHGYLEEKNSKHRGTHGVADQQWKMFLSSPQEEEFKNSILKNAKEIEKGKEPFQFRKLSIDDFEKNIKLGESKSLLDLKIDLGLIAPIKKLYNEEFNSSIIYELNTEILPSNNFSYDPNVLKVIGENGEHFDKNLDDLYC